MDDLPGMQKNGSAMLTQQVAGVQRARLERFRLPLALLSIVLLLVCSAALLLQEAGGLEGVGPAGGRAEFLKIVGRGREPPPERDTVVEESWDFGGATFSRLSLIVEALNTSQQRLPVLLAMPNVGRPVPPTPAFLYCQLNPFAGPGSCRFSNTAVKRSPVCIQ
jgi:hypothetical protein